MVRDQPPTNKPSSPLEQFAVALSHLLRAARSYHRQIEGGIDRLESLHVEAQLTAPTGISLPAFRRAIWPLDRLDPVWGSTDGGETYKMVPSYVFVQHGSPQAVEEYIAQLTALAEAVQRRLESAEQETTPKTQPAPTSSPIIYHIAANIYRVGDSRPYEVNDDENAILQAFMRRPAMSEKTLKSETKNPEIRPVLMRLLDKYDGAFAAAIGRPLGKSSGGYCADVRRADKS